MDAYLIEELAGQGDVYQFSHALVQQTLRERFSNSRRVRLRARIGKALETLYKDQLGDRAGELAHHFFEASPVLGNVKLVRYSLLADEEALAVYAHEQALEHFQRGLTSKKSQSMDFESAGLMFGIGRSLAATLQISEIQDALDNLESAFRYYAESGNVS